MSLAYDIHKAWLQSDIANIPGLYFYLTLLTLMMFGIKTWLFRAYSLSTPFLTISSITSRTYILTSSLFQTVGDVT